MAWLKQRGNGYYYILWYEGQAKNGKSRKCMTSLKTKNAKRARLVFQIQEEKLYFKKQGLLIIDKIDIQSFIPRLESYLKAHFENQHTQRKYFGHYRLFAEFMRKKHKVIRHINEVKNVHFSEFITYEQQQENKKSLHSINSEIRSLHRVFRIAKDLNHTNENPADGLSIITTKKPPVNVYKQDEIRLMFKFAEDKPILETMLLLLLQTGARKQEVANFDDGDFNKQNRSLRVFAKDDWTPKRGKERILKLSSKLTSMIDKIKTTGSYIFTQPEGRAKGKKFSDSQLYRFIIYDFVDKLGIKGDVHKFRDTYASYSLACGVDMAKVKQRLGHESLKETDRYSMAINETIGNDIKNIFIGNEGELQSG